ncbi:hypothetical protein ACG0Z6_05390 [Roseateles sp. BYS180W]|uniref:Uncharacterized protein n=1 Tax=Roseateles rivi TaxID=3299028 RepID=A0ABW7FTM5_9BURK
MTEASHFFADVSIVQVEAYLVSKAWFMDGSVGSVGTLWHRDGDAVAEVALPRHPGVRDFRKRFNEALAAISDFEGRPVPEVVADVLLLSSSLITVRVIGADTAHGTIPINDGVLLFTKAKDLLCAAALSMYSKRKQFSGQLPKDAKTYLDSLLLGQTEIGSYVVNVIAPLSPPRPASEPNAGPGGPVAEAVTLNLVNGLEALSKAAAEFSDSRSLKAFDAAVERGVSANMCDALVGFSGIERSRDFEVRVSGAAGPMFEGETKVFSFDADTVAAVQKASDYYKGDYTLEERNIWGFVKKLDRPKGDEVGTITVEAAIDGVERSIKIMLQPDEYHQAVLAHDTKAIVACSGSIHIKNRRATLLNPTRFRIIPRDQLF